MSKSRLCKIIPAEVTEVLEGSYILSLPDGEQYKVEGDNIPMKKGSLIRFEKDTFLKLTNDAFVDDIEEITLVKEESSDREANNDLETSRFGKEKNYAVWQDDATRLLLSLYKELRPSVNGIELKTKKNMWEKISEHMRKEGYNFDFQQVESKWKSLVRSYRTGIMNGTKRKAHYTVGQFEQEIGDILTSQGISFEVINMDESQDDEENNQTSHSLPSSPNENKKFLKTFDENTGAVTPSNMSLLIRAINKRTKQKEMSDKIKEDQRERLISAIQERNQLLKKIYSQKENR